VGAEVAADGMQLRVWAPSRSAVLDGLVAHIGDACLGQVSEVFDAEPPFASRGCVAQAWGVAELARALLATAGPG
jgi:glycogen debranching enzyme